MQLKKIQVSLKDQVTSKELAKIKGGNNESVEIIIPDVEIG